MANNKWTTPVEWPGLNQRFGYQHSFLLCGSCFADRVGQKLRRARFNATVNPGGIAFDPLSLARHADQALMQHIPGENELVYHDGLWHSMQHHGSFSSESKSETLCKITDGMQAMLQALSKAHLIIFTFGSAWYMEHLETQQAITNAHRIPAEQFKKRLATTDQITDCFLQLIPRIQRHNPTAQFMISVSPVRYLRDGIEGNMRSKARLIESAHQICEVIQHVHYFPAYEIVMDELRDYRWYADDMLHVSPVAVDYIWGKFRDGTIDQESLAMMQQIEPLIKYTEHRPIHQSPDNYEKKCAAKQNEVNHLIALLTSRSS